MRLRHPLALVFVAALLASAPSRAASPAEELLAAAIAYHDVDGVWASSAWRLALEETRPGGGVRATTLVLDPLAERFDWRREEEGVVVEGTLAGGECEHRLNGSADFTDDEREEHRLTCERLTLLRDYYTYLWGLPMKLRDPGTVLAPEVLETEFDGRRVLGLEVTYEEPVGLDLWTFYFDPTTKALMGYRFYHDEAVNDGEFIELEGEIEGGGLRLPKARTWYTHADGELLGTDTLIAIERLPSGAR